MHFPVLSKEIIDYLDPKPNENFIDATFGQGGHTLKILERTKPKGKVLAIEIDPELYEKMRKEIRNKKEWKEKRERLILVNSSFTNLKEIVKREKFENIKGILFDLGLSSWHLEESKRGFTFLKNEPLNMRYDGKINELTAKDILNKWSKKEIERILKEYAQERFAKRISEKIVKERKEKKIETTFQLVQIIKKATPKWYHFKRIHFATRVFLALRIAVNNELENLKRGLEQALEILKSGGKIAVISFHSGEDKIVKNFFKENKSKLKILTKKPIVPQKEEIVQNLKSRSAKLRVAIKI